MTQLAPGAAEADFAHLTPAETARLLDVDPAEGLDPHEAGRRLAEHGPNRLAQAARRPAWKRFLDQFRDTLAYILMGAAVVSAAVGDLKDPLVILGVLVVNAIFGYIQENRADEAMAALSKMLELVVRVRRGGGVEECPAAELVPGDVVLLEAGDRVPADGRFVLARNLAVEESALTGESVPSDKHTATLAEDEGGGIGDRANCGFMNSTVARGRGEMVVTATGMDTEVGRLAGLLAEAGDQATPLQVQLDALGRRLALIAIVAVAVLFVVSIAQGEKLSDAMLESVALAVAAIPEGLPVVVTVTLALGVSRMARHNAIVKRLASVETLGATTAISSDKTGTLTLNEMTVTRVSLADGRFDVTGLGYGTDGTITPDGAGASEAADGADDDWAQRVADAARLGVLCNDAVLRTDEEGRPGMVGDPTEAALVVLGAKAGLDPQAERARLPRSAEVPFDSSTKFMATLHPHPDDEGSALMVVKGAPDVVLARCDTLRSGGEALSLDDGMRDRVQEANEALGAEGLRVLAVASRRLPLRADEFEADLAEEVTGLTAEMLVGILDPARPEAVAAIDECRRAGITVRMITGDHASTAGAIAATLGIEGEVVSGAELDEMTDDELAGRIEGIGVCARVSPEHKVRVVRALKANGEVTAMTGDGVNDAPALKNADIGVAMGITGTEVTKEAGDMVLTDDNFATIVAAVEGGRAIYDNILSFVRFQLTTNVAAIGTILGARLVGLPAPFNPIQVLFVNVIADGPPAMSLGVDPPKEGLMDLAPRDKGASILNGERLTRIVLVAAFMTAVTLGMIAVGRDRTAEESLLTMAFTTFVLLQMANALAVRVGEGTIFSSHTLTNRALWVALGSVVAVQVAVVEVPFMQTLFETVGLTATQWAICFGAAVGFLLVDELRRMAERALARRRGEVATT